MPGEDDAKLKELGWRQGSVLPETLVRRLVEQGSLPPLPEDVIVLVVSHDCDITSISFELEPRAEVLICRRVDRPDGNYTSGKNPRLLHFGVEMHGEAVALSASASERLAIDRGYLNDVEPDPGIAVDRRTVRTVRNWCADRYSREAFPDEFNRRLSGVGQRIEDKLKQGGNQLAAIYLLVEEAELPPGTDYVVDIVGAMLEKDYEDPERLDAAQQAIDSMEAFLAQAEGVRVGRAVVASERTITLADLRFLKRWDYDALSLRLDPPAPVPPGR